MLVKLVHSLTGGSVDSIYHIWKAIKPFRSALQFCGFSGSSSTLLDVPKDQHFFVNVHAPKQFHYAEMIRGYYRWCTNQPILSHRL